jgi:flagellar protein FliS
MQSYEQSGYIADRVLTASPVELIRMLYEAACDSVDCAIEMLRANDVMARGAAITKAVDIIQELRAGLNSSAYPEYAANMASLYDYMQQRLMQAHARKSEERLLEVRSLLKHLLESWSQLERQIRHAHVEQSAIAHEPVNRVEPIWTDPYAALSPAVPASRSWHA